MKLRRNKKPKSPQAYKRLGEYYKSQGDLAVASKHFKSAAELYFNDGFYHQAKDCYEEILAIENDNIEARWQIADVCKKLGYMYEAVRHLQVVSDIFLNIGKDDEAIEVLKHIIELDPRNASIRRKLSGLYFKMGLHEQGEAEKEKAEEMEREGDEGLD